MSAAAAAGAGLDSSGNGQRRKSGRSSNRSSRTSATSGPGTGTGSPAPMDSGGSGRSGFDTAEMAIGGWASGEGVCLVYSTFQRFFVGFGFLTPFRLLRFRFSDFMLEEKVFMSHDKRFFCCGFIYFFITTPSECLMLDASLHARTIGDSEKTPVHSFHQHMI